MNIDSCVIRAKLVGESQCIRSGITLLHCTDHQGGQPRRVLHMVALVPVGKTASRVDPLDRWRGVSGEHCRQSQWLPRFCTDV